MLLKQIGLDVSPTKPLNELSIGRRQMVEIAKAMSMGCADHGRAHFKSVHTGAEIVEVVRHDGWRQYHLHSHRLVR